MEEGPAVVKKRSPVSDRPGNLIAERKGAVHHISVNPTNNITIIGQRLVAAVKPATSLRYNLMWAYGGYLVLIPRRLGINEALDAAVDALVTAYQSFASCKQVFIGSLTKYSRALNALSRCLDNPVTATTSETLCAVSVMLLVQHLIGPGGLKWTGHAEGAAKVLKARKSLAPRDSFEQMLLLSLRGPVLFEGLFNPHIDFTPQEWKELVENDLDAQTPESEMLLNLSRVRDILFRAKNNPDGLAGLLILQAEIRSLYAKTRKICDIFRVGLKEVEDPGENGPPNPHGLPPAWIHAHIQRFYGLAVSIALYINYAAVALRTPDLDLIPDATYLAMEMIDIAENAMQYRPFGAGYVIIGLIAASVAIDNPPLQDLIHSWIDDYRQDFHMPNLEAYTLVEAFARLDPFEGQEMPDPWSHTEEHAVYDPLLLEEELTETSRVWDVSSDLSI
ncbi:hypothetical protein BDV18DRAFT_138644 [Aspergillus unguis]